MIKQFSWILFLPLAAYISLCIYLYLVQRSILYYPTPPADSTRAAALYFTNDNHSLKVWHIERESGKALIYFGGNAEDVSQTIPHFMHLFPDHSLYLLNYRGYGGSSGKPTEKALFSDAAALYDSIRDRYTEIAVKGRSLGTGVAVYLASTRPVSRLLLVTPFDSMASVAGHYYPYLPVNLFLQDRYDSIRLAGAIRIPTLVLIAEYDNIIPRENSDNLAETLDPEITTIAVIDDTDHNDIGVSPDYERAIRKFMVATISKDQKELF